MAFVLPEMTQDTTTISGTGVYTMSGAPAGFNPFSAVLSNGDATIYAVFDSSIPPEYEINFGTYSTSNNTLTRAITLRSSNAGAPITWPGGGAFKNVVAGTPGILLQTLFELQYDGSTGVLEFESGSPVPTFAVTPIGATGRALLDDTSADAARATITAMKRDFSDQTLLTAQGDLLYMLTAAIETRLAIGGSGTFLRSTGTLPAWATPASTEVSHSPTSPLTGTTVGAALDELSHAHATYTQSTTQDNFGTSEVAVSDLDNLSIPGTGDSTKQYRCTGQVTVNGIDNATRYVIVRLRVGTAGTVADALVAATEVVYSNTGNGTVSCPIPTKPFTPGASDKVTISVECNANTGQGDVDTGGDTFVTIEQISNA